MKFVLRDLAPCWTALALCWITLSLTGFAASLPDEFTRQLWRVQDGLPEDIVQAAVQDARGFLWVGTTGGLARFDGSDFSILDSTSTPRLPVNSVFCLLAGRDPRGVAGVQDSEPDLWMGSEGGGLLRLRGGALTHLGAAEGLSDPFVRALLEDEHGAIWVGTDNGLFLLPAGASRLRRLDGPGSGSGAGAAVAPLAVHAIAEDSQHTIWVGGSRLIAFRNGSAQPPEEHPLPGLYSQNRVKSILPARDGTLWVGTVGGLVRLRNKLPVPIPGSGRSGGPRSQFEQVSGVEGTVRALYQTSDGAIWIGTIGHGLWRYDQGRLQKIDAGDLLPSKSVLSITEDARRQVWLGTQGGLVRLSRTPVHVLPLPQAADPDFATVSRDLGDAVWVVASSVFRITQGGSGAQAEPKRFPELGNPPVRNLLRARDGSLWVGTDGDGAYREHEGAIEHYQAPQLTSNFIRAFLEGPRGDVWIAGDEGLNHLVNGRVDRYTMRDGLAYFSTRCLLQARGGDVWIGTEQGLSHWADGHFIIDEVTQSLAREKVWSLAEDAEGFLWIGTRDHGLFRARGTAVQSFTRAQGLPTNSIYSIVSAGGRLWFSGPNTLFSASLKELDASDGNPEHSLHTAIYALPFRAGDAQFYGGRQPSVARDEAGRLWFPSSRGAVYLEPGEAESEPPPTLFVRSVLVDGQAVDLARGVQLAADSRRLAINYTPLMLGAQSGVRFRYRLEGFDKAWTYAGAARSASYTNLPAGHFHFRVESLDGNPVASASLAVEKQPFFWQTWWFAAGAVLLLAGAGFSAYRLRLAQIRERFDAVLVERGRLAREMHDTVIQGCTSISALLEAIASRRNAGGPGSGEMRGREGELLDYARTQVRATINEAREAVWNLRHKVEPERRLPEMLEAMTTAASREFNVPVSCRCEGEVVLLGGSPAHELSMMVREALYNAALHGQPRGIEVVAEGEAETLRLRVSDDGTGFVPRAHAEHFGITGMRERAARLGGTLEVRSAPGEGTVVEMVLGRASLRHATERKGWE